MLVDQPFNQIYYLRGLLFYVLGNNVQKIYLRRGFRVNQFLNKWILEDGLSSTICHYEFDQDVNLLS